MKFGSIAGVITLLILLCAQLEARTWTNVDGRQIEAEFVKAEGEFVHLLLASSSRKTVKVNISTLSQEDRDYITERVREELLEKLSNKDKYHTITDGQSILSFPRINDARVTYKVNRNSASLTVLDRNRDEMNIPFEGSGTVRVSTSTNLTATTIKEADMHSTEYDSTEIFDLPAGAKFLVYTNLDKNGTDITERRCLIWQIIDGSVVKFDFTNRSQSSPGRTTRSLSVITDTLQGLRMNTAIIPHMDIFQDVLIGADTSSFAEKLKKASEETSPLELTRGEDKVSIPRISGDRAEQNANEIQQSLQFQIDPKAPGIADRLSMTAVVTLVQDSEIPKLIENNKKYHSTGYDTYYIRDLPDGAKILVVNKEGRRPTESLRRKAVLYRKLGESVLQIELSETLWPENPHRHADIDTICKLLDEIRVNGQPISGWDILSDACFSTSWTPVRLQDIFRNIR